jgi:hypothetical protein
VNIYPYILRGLQLLIHIGIKPFHLHPNLDEPWLCLVRALLKWIKLLELIEGHLFRQVNANDQVSMTDKQLVSNLKL